MMFLQPKDVPVFILCGGLGTRIKEETELRPKPMVPIGGKPLLWHIMTSYRRFGFRKFILCLGFKSEVIKEYFLNYHALNSDFTIDLKSGEMVLHETHHPEDWAVTLAFTGEGTMTGARVSRAAERYLGAAEHFAVTYGDGLTDAPLDEELAFHLKHGKAATLLGINPPSRFGEIQIEGDSVSRFCEKPHFHEKYINGGYFFFHRKALGYLSSDESCVLERTPLVNLAADGELNMFRHPGFWACMDTQRDRDMLEELWRKGDTPWLKAGANAAY